MGRPRINKLIEAICICSKKFQTDSKRISMGRGKFCSKECHYANKTRKSGLKYKIKIVNKGWYKENIIPATAWKPGDMAGSKNPNWKGGISKETSPSKIEKQKLSSKIKKWKRQIIKRDGRICCICGSTEKIEVDHIKPWATHPELRFDLNNGRVLCNSCHRNTESYGARTK